MAPTAPFCKPLPTTCAPNPTLAWMAAVWPSPKSARPLWATAPATVNHDTNKSYGPELNAVGGGWYVMERTSQVVNVWFGARGDENVPDEVKDAATLKESQEVNPDACGQPQANFAASGYQAVAPLLASIRPSALSFFLAKPLAPLYFYASGVLDHVNNDPAAFRDAY
ncbi:hypothetical protein M407DRAFT_32626 [Tulasnella calospora MUT 4182]|uniref:Uncharacterized protein n=1 Tax=Tulasnella calospora MUT 4182 TaxID=1051891 RepID=A0A0C3PSK3_9AGAM|nr:hypothetical protein M407DRAFT_32626 [Tulasnella calospora MUT 4182]